jgi:hypothetical protein
MSRDPLARCSALISYGPDGASTEPRQCRHGAKERGLCGLHAGMAAPVHVSDGGWCVWCGGPGRRYVKPPAVVAIVLCGACRHVLAKTLWRESRYARQGHVA